MRRFTLDDFMNKKLFVLKDDPEQYMTMLEDLEEENVITPLGRSPTKFFHMHSGRLIGYDSPSKRVYTQSIDTIPVIQRVYASDYAAKHQPCFQDIDNILSEPNNP